MKMRNVLLGLVAVILFCLSACKKDNIDSLDPQPPVITSADSVYLSKVYLYDTYSNFIDTGGRRYYLYDNLKRVINIIDTGYEAGATMPPITYSKTQYFYNGNDTLPYKKITISKIVSIANVSKDTATSFYTFNQNAQLISDSTINSFDGYYFPSNVLVKTIKKTVQSLTYVGNKIYGLQQLSYLQNLNGSSQNQSYTRRDTVSKDGLGNIISASYKKIYPNPAFGPDYHYATFTYDNKYSPFYKINIQKTISFFNLSFYRDASSYYEIGPNNILKIHEVSILSNNNQIIYDVDNTGIYSYKQNGFLGSALIISPSYTTKLTFIYTSF
jgi:hypothetical protein